MDELYKWPQKDSWKKKKKNWKLCPKYTRDRASII